MARGIIHSVGSFLSCYYIMLGIMKIESQGSKKVSKLSVRTRT